MQWLADDPDLVARKLYANPTRFVFRVAEIKPPDPKIGVIAGDLVHELRSALDHVVWQLVCQNAGVPGDHLQFPIYLNKPPNFYKDTKRRLRDVAPVARQHIERMQPYHRGDKAKITRHPLAIVRTINNEDKHRVVLETVSALEFPGPSLSFPRNEDVGKVHETLIHWGKPLTPGQRIATVRFDAVGPNPEIEVQGNLPMDVAVGEIGARVASLPGLCGEVWRLIASFKPFFPQEGWPLDVRNPTPPPESLAP